MEELQTQGTPKKRITSSLIAKIAILSAVGYILYLFVKFPLPFFPAFLDMQFSDLTGLIGGFMLGPIPGCTIILIKGILKLPFTGTACVGELADVLIGIAFVLPASLLYRKRKTLKRALLGLAVGMACSVVMSMLMNWLVLIPFYLQMMFGGNWEPLLGMCRVLNENISVENFYEIYIFAGVLPFNLLRCTVTSVLTYLVYKPLHRLFNRF